MRLYPVLALVSSALALAACGGGGGGLSSGVASRASVLNVCAITDKSCIPSTGGTPTTPAIRDTDGDGIPDNVDTDGGIGSGAGGNTTGATTGTRTIAIASSNLDKPTTAPTALAILTSGTKNQADTQADILSTTKPKSVKFAIDTKSGTNSQWAVPIEQTEFDRGTRDLTWIEFRHISTAPLLLPKDVNGNPVLRQGGTVVGVYDTERQAYVATVAHSGGGRSYNVGTTIDTTNDFYWNQLTPYMGSKANGGARGGYREYRAIDSSIGRDEVLQVWAWSGDSYSAHYINRSGDDPKQHAWTYGGNASTTMPTSGEATYRGRFVGNAKTSNWKPLEGAEINPNASWRIQGRSDLKATFGTNSIRGTLTPETWTSQQSIKENAGEYTWFTQEAANNQDPVGDIDTTLTPSIGDDLRPNYYEIYDTQITLDGKIKAAAGAPTTGTPLLNNFDGTATLSNPYISSNNKMYGGFFGTNGKEVAGIFNVSGTTVDPVGGSDGLNGDRAAFIDINGSFNGCKVVPSPTSPNDPNDSAPVRNCAP